MTPTNEAPRPVTPRVLGAFFLFAAAMSGFAAATLTVPGGPLDPIWRLKPGEHAQLLALGPWVGPAFAALGVTAALGAAGAFRRRRWGWWIAVIGLAGNGLGDAAHGLAGAWIDGLAGVAIAGAALWWLTRPRVRALFRT